MKGRIECGNIYFIDLKNRFGHEYKGLRPYVVIDGNEFISFSNVVCVTPLTSKLSKKRRYDVLAAMDTYNNLKTDSLIRLDQIDNIDKQYLGYCLGKISKNLIKQIHYNLRNRFNY